jgi:hypothetical protein
MKRFQIAFQVLAAVAAVAVPSAVFAQDGTAGRDVAPQAVTTLTKCTAGHLSFKTDNASPSASTTSTSFVDVANTSITFKIGGTKPACATVTFSGYTFAAAGSELMFVQAVIDGVPIAPGSVQFSGDDDEDSDGAWARSHQAQWIAPGLAPGTHTAKIQFMSLTGQTVFIHKATTTVVSK